MHELPKGMIVPELVNREVSVAHRSLENGNYVSEIYKALRAAEVELCIGECVVIERLNQMPEIQLKIYVAGRRGSCNDD